VRLRRPRVELYLPFIEASFALSRALRKDGDMALPLLRSRVEIAPPRGTYDRQLTPESRAQEQQERILQSVVEMLAALGIAALTVDSIVIHAGMSRATFYQLYDGLDAALEDVWRRAEQLLCDYPRRAMQDQATPRAQLAAAAGSFLAQVEANPHLALAALTNRSGAAQEPRLEQALQALAAGWLESAAQAGLVARETSPLVSCWIAALFCASAQHLLAQNGSASTHRLADSLLGAALAVAR